MTAQTGYVSGESAALLWSRITSVEDWPSPGVSFKDLSGVLEHGPAFSLVIDALAERVDNAALDAVVGIEARGFPYAAALAYRLGIGFVTLRKPGKLPRAVHSQEYSLEYGVATLEMHQDALDQHERVLIVDDVLATGGTAAAAVELVLRTKTEIEAVAVIMEIPFLQGRGVLEAAGVDVIALLDASAPHEIRR
jgi:adenine phosphoribosyltransferase